MANRVVVFSRAGCCLCDEALSELEALKAELSLSISVTDIAGDAELEARYGESIPVGYLNDQLAFKGHVDASRLRKRLRGGGILDRLSARFGLSR